MHNGHGYSPSRSRNQSSRRNMRDVSGPVVPSTPRDTGDGEHLRRRTTFTTKPPTRRDDHRPGGRLNINPRVTTGVTGTNKFRNFLSNIKPKQWWSDTDDEDILKTGAVTALGPLSVLKGKEYLGDVSKINQWSKMGYGTGNPVPQKMLDTLKGSWVPNKTYEKLGKGPGSLKDWWNKTISPKHFQPAQKVINPLVKGLTRASLPVTALSGAFYGGEKLSDYLEPAGIALSSTLGGANIQDPMYSQLNRGGIANLRTGFQGGGPQDWGQQERREGPYSPSNMSQREYDRLQEISPSGGGRDNIEAILESHRGPSPRGEVFGPFPPKGSRLGEPMFSTIQQGKIYAEMLKQKEEEEERKRKDEEVAKTLAEMWHHDPGFEGKIGPFSGALTYEPEDPLGTYAIDAGIKTGPLSLGYSTGAELDDRYSLGVGFPSGGLGLLTDKGTGDVMGGGQISTGPYTIEGGYGTGGPEWALGININKPFRSRGLLKKRIKKVPAPYARGGILGAF